MMQTVHPSKLETKNSTNEVNQRSVNIRKRHRRNTANQLFIPFFKTSRGKGVDLKLVADKDIRTVKTI